MNRMIFRDRFFTKNLTPVCLEGIRVATYSISEPPLRDSSAMLSDPLAALEQQNRHAAEIESSRVESIMFERVPTVITIAPGCVLESEEFGNSFRVVRYSPTEMMAEVEAA